MAGTGQTGGKTGETEERPNPPGAGSEEEMPRIRLTRRQVILFGIFVFSAIAFLYFVLPKLTDAGATVHRIERGDTWWIIIGVLLEGLSFGGYVVLFRSVFVSREHPHSHLERIGWLETPVEERRPSVWHANARNVSTRPCDNARH